MVQSDFYGLSHRLQLVSSPTSRRLSDAQSAMGPHPGALGSTAEELLQHLVGGGQGWQMSTVKNCSMQIAFLALKWIFKYWCFRGRGRNCWVHGQEGKAKNGTHHSFIGPFLVQSSRSRHMVLCDLWAIGCGWLPRV